MQISRRHLADGRAAAVVLNSGNANAATGEQGRADALRMCELTATGARVRDHRRARVPDRPHRHPDADGPGRIRHPEARRAADRRRRRRVRRGRRDAHHRHRAARRPHRPVDLPTPGTATVGGMAKGAAMLAPAMATMLAVLTTDVAVAAAAAPARCSTTAVDTSFNALVVDGCQSTNDTVLVLANGAVGNEPITTTSGLAYAGVRRGAHRRVRRPRPPDGDRRRGRDQAASPLTVRGARNDAEARHAARAVASSQLVQCSLYGKDPYWGRMLSELGVSGAVFDPERVEIAYDGVVVCRNGIAAAARRRRGGARRMDQRDIEIACDLRAGTGDATDALHRPHARVRRREHGHVMSATADATDVHDKARDPRRGAAVHPRVHGQDRRDQVRRPRDGGPRARRPVRAGRRAHAARRHEPGRRARRRPADHRPHAPARQGAGVRRRAAGHRRRDRRHRAHGARRQGQPRDRRGAQPARLVRGRAVGRGRRAHHGRDARRAARVRRRRHQHRPVDRRSKLLREELIPVDRDRRASTSSVRPTTSTPTRWPARSPLAVGAEKLVYLTDVAGLYDDFATSRALISADRRRRARAVARRRQGRRRG